MGVSEPESERPWPWTTDGREGFTWSANAGRIEAVVTRVSTLTVFLRRV
jgi:hypothetical protein